MAVEDAAIVEPSSFPEPEIAEEKPTLAITPSIQQPKIEATSGQAVSVSALSLSSIRAKKNYKSKLTPIAKKK